MLVHGSDLSKQGLWHIRFAIHSSAWFAMFGLWAFNSAEGPPLKGWMMSEMLSIRFEIQAARPDRKG